MTATMGKGCAPTVSLDPFAMEFLSDPFCHYAALRDAGPVVYLDAIGAFGMARYDEVSASLKDFHTFCSGRGVGLADFAHETPYRPPSLLLEADPPLHARTRGLMNKVVGLNVLKGVRPRWKEHAEALVDRLVTQRRFDAVVDLSEAYPMMIFPETIGLPLEGREMLLEYATAVFNAFGPRNALFEESNRKAAAASAWVNSACLRANLTNDGWGASVYAAADRGECSEDEAGRLVRSFLSAGVDTTVNGIAHMILAFARFPDQWQALRKTPALAKRVFDESLRWDSTVQTFFRTATRDVEISGVRIPEGAKVLLFLAAANSDPRRWLEPERFDITRATSGHVGFGFGIHQCLGQMVARQEAEIVLEALLSRVCSIRLVGEPVRRLNNTLHALASLPVEIDPL